MPAPRALASAEIRGWDRLASERYGIPSIVLMENAGAGAARVLDSLARLASDPCPPPYLILCGPGNNGGDGLVAARHLHNLGYGVEVLAPGQPAYAAAPDAAVHFEVVRRMALPGDLGQLRGPPPPGGLARNGRGTIVDALFGTGLSRPLREPYADWVKAINASGLRVVALDIPSGLHADTGEALGVAVKADHTVTFAAPKLGFTLGKGPECCGAIHVVDIGIPRELLEGGGAAGGALHS